MRKICLLTMIACCSGTAFSMEDDNPLKATWIFDQLEYTAGDGGSGAAWDMHGWAGGDINRARLMTEGEYRDGSGEGFLRLVYSRAILPFWDVAGGWRREFGDGPQWDAATVEMIGTLPYNIATNASFSIGENGQTQIWSRFEYALSFNPRTPRWVLVPELEFSAYGKDQPDRGVGSGLSGLELELRIHRQIRPNLSPYIGVSWEKQFGDTADFSSAAGEETSELRGVLGLRFWF